MRKGLLRRDNAVLLLIDIQERFRPVIYEMDRVVENTSKLAKAFRIMDLPIIVTEQNPEKLGRTVLELRQALGVYKPVEKLCFSCFASEEFVKAIESLRRKQIVIAGIESHICVLRTAIDAVAKGYEVHIAYDATSSRKRMDWGVSKIRFLQANAYLDTTESVIFQLMDFAATNEFRRIRNVIVG